MSWSRDLWEALDKKPVSWSDVGKIINGLQSDQEGGAALLMVCTKLAGLGDRAAHKTIYDAIKDDHPGWVVPEDYVPPALPDARTLHWPGPKAGDIYMGICWLDHGVEHGWYWPVPHNVLELVIRTCVTKHL